MTPFRADIWTAAFIRRHNDLGHLCVVSRKGDPVAGQILLHIDHLDGTASLLTPAPLAAHPEDAADRVFQQRFDHADPVLVAARIAREIDFDPDAWVLDLEMRRGDPGVTMVRAPSA